jgi:hypothetical protein
MISKWIGWDAEGNISVLVWGAVPAFAWRIWERPRNPLLNLSFGAETSLRDTPLTWMLPLMLPSGPRCFIKPCMWRSQVGYPFFLFYGSRGILSHGDETADDLRVVAFWIPQQQFCSQSAFIRLCKFCQRNCTGNDVSKGVVFVVTIDVNIPFPCVRDGNYFSWHSIIVMEMSFLHDTKCFCMQYQVCTHFVK